MREPGREKQVSGALRPLPGKRDGSRGAALEASAKQCVLRALAGPAELPDLLLGDSRLRQMLPLASVARAQVVADLDLVG
jgi:hypothetical protein